jgi:glycosyltransferase involved in cell wall biosynthesis
VDEISEDGSLRIRSALSAGSAEHPKTRLDRCLAGDMFILPSAAMIARPAFDAVGGFDEQLDDYENEDFFLRLFHLGYRNVYIEQPLGQWLVCAGSAVHAARTSESRMRFARKLLRMFPDEPDLSHFYARDLIAPRFLAQTVTDARAALRAGDIARAEARFEDITFLERHVSAERKPYPLRDGLFITVVIPLYDGGRFIREALTSVFDQILVPDEIIVVDDGSSDDGPDIVREMGRQRPIRLISKPNGGQSSARNLGVDHAHGDLIAFLDQDDAWYPNHLSELVKPFLEPRQVEIGWTYCDLDEVNESGEMVAREVLVKTKAKHPKRELGDCLRNDMFILPSASLVSRRAFRQVGGFDERLSGYEDDDLFLRLFQAGFDNVFLPQALSRWRIWGISSSYSPRMAISRMTYARKLIQRFPDDCTMDRFPIRDWIAPRFVRLLALEMRNAALRGTREHRHATLRDLHFMTGYLRNVYRWPLRFIVLPALRIPPLARFVMRYQGLLLSIVRRGF